jgi:hypothetical protein
LTGTIKVESLASVKPRAPRAPRKKAPAKATAANSPAQVANGQKRWNGVSQAERSENMRELARQRWAADEQRDADDKKYFESVDLDEAMESYQQMRRTFEAAGKILDARFQAERQADEKCSNPACGKHFDRNTPWYSRNAKRNPITGAAYNEFACSMECLIAIKGVGTEHRALAGRGAATPPAR